MDFKDKNYNLPADHKPGLKVPHGGSCCKNCEYVVPSDSGDVGNCRNEYYIKWHGSSKIPAPLAEYCSDWYEPGK